MNKRNEEMMEAADLDQDIQRRKELIEEAKKLDLTKGEREIVREISDLRRKWKRLSYWGSAYEESLSEEFDGYLDVFYAKRREEYKVNQESKEALVSHAQKIASSSEWNKVTQKMHELMSQWKEIRTAGREEDERLWDEFNQARQTFFDRKHQHWEGMKDQFENARKIKEELIQKAEEIKKSTDWKNTSEQFKLMMDQWKQAGSAGRQHEEELWTKFNEIRQVFYGQREEHYEEVRGVEEENYNKKEAIVHQAKEIIGKEEFSKEQTNQMKQFGNDWKEIGFAGKVKDDQIWKEFRAVMDQYFDGLKSFSENRQFEWRQRMQDARGRKQELIAKQKNQLKRMQEDMVGLISERAVEELKERMEDKKEFIAELEADVEDIDKKLSER